METLKVFLEQQGQDIAIWPEFHLLRFLRARKFDQPATQLMVQNYLNWRKDENVDNIETEFKFEEYDQVQEVYPHGYHKIDKLGRPCYIERLGLLNVTKLFEITNEERMVKHYIQEYERLMIHKYPACTAAFNGEHAICSGFTIMDMTGGGISTFNSQVRALVKLAASIGSDYYPEIMGNLFVINAPMLFSGVWSVVKGFLDERTRNKIKILGSGYMKTLLEYMEEEDLPEFLGGKCTCEEFGGNCLTSNRGPWNNYEPIAPFGIAVRPISEKKAIVEEVGADEEQKQDTPEAQVQADAQPEAQPETQSQNQNNEEEIKDNTA